MFLIDPHPYGSIVVQNCPGTTEPCAVPTGEDKDLEAQRAAFLRLDSLVAVIMLSDENDCSIRESGQTNTKPDGTAYSNAGELHYQTAAQLLANGTWGVVLGNDDPGGNALRSCPPTPS